MKKLPPYYTIVWITTKDMFGEGKFMAYRIAHRRGRGMKYNGTWSWRVLTSTTPLSLKPDKVIAWEKLADKQTKEGVREYD
jgi:hypothetical protein